MVKLCLSFVCLFLFHLQQSGPRKREKSEMRWNISVELRVDKELKVNTHSYCIMLQETLCFPFLPCQTPEGAKSQKHGFHGKQLSVASSPRSSKWRPFQVQRFNMEQLVGAISVRVKEWQMCLATQYGHRKQTNAWANVDLSGILSIVIWNWRPSDVGEAPKHGFVIHIRLLRGDSVRNERGTLAWTLNSNWSKSRNLSMCQMLSLDWCVVS